MKSINLLLCCFMFAISHYGVSQISNLNGVLNEPLREKEYSQIEGSPYLFDRFHRGKLFSFNNNIYTKYLLNYDTFEGNVVVLDNNVMIILDQMVYPKFTIEVRDPVTNNKKILEFQNGVRFIGLSNEKYYEVLYSGDVLLLKDYHTTIENNKDITYGTPGHRMFSKKEELFLVFNGKALEIPGTKRKFSALFKERKQEVLRLIKSKNLSFRKEEDLIEILQYLNQEDL